MGPFPFESWAPSQWIAFCGLLTAGLSALLLLTLAVRSVRAWRTPQTYYARRPVARPTLALAARRVQSEPHIGALLARATADMPGGAWRTVHTDVAEHLAAGAGSLTDLAATGPGLLERVELVDAETRRWFAEAFDRPAHVPGRDEAGELDEGGVLTRFRAALESSMRTAHLWEIQGRGHAGHDSARMTLDDWRAGTCTGEWALVPPVGGLLPILASY